MGAIMISTFDGEKYKKIVAKYYHRLDGAFYYFAAPTTDELLVELPNLSISMINKCFIVENHQLKYSNSSMFLCEALASMYLYLVKEGLIGGKK